MKSLASLALLLVAASTSAQEPPSGEGPRGSSQLAAGETRYDIVGYATRGELPGVSAGSRDLPPGSYAEITALDSGRTIVAAIVGYDVPMTGLLILSNGAADALGMTGRDFAVRVRKVVPTPQDIVALRNGSGGSYRADAPPALLSALRKKLPVATANTKRLRTPVTRSPARHDSAPPAAAGVFVQVAAVSSAARAETIARAVAGSVAPGPPLWRVTVGPFPDSAAAARAAADVVRRGYPGAQIIRSR